MKLLPSPVSTVFRVSLRRSCHDDGVNTVAAATGPLAGIQILDITTVVMGPYATQLLGDLGADVIKIEELGGDLSRAMGPGPHPEFSGTALNLHRNKRSMILDLKDPNNRRTVDALVRWADVLVTNLRPGPLTRLGLTYEACAALRSDIVFCQAHGWPSDSPDADRPAYDDVIQTATGVPDLMERTTGKVALFPSIVADKVCGQTIVNGVLAALYHRAKTGVGQRVEVAMYDSMLAFNLVEHLAAATTEPPLGPTGYSRVTTPQRGPKQATDGWITMLPYDTRQWRALFAAGGMDTALDDDRFATASARATHADAIYALLAELISTRSVAEWVRICASIGVAAEPVLSLDQVVDHALVTGALTVEEHPLVGTYRQIQPSIRFDATPQNVRRYAPLIGQHTEEILHELTDMSPSSLRPMGSED
jgi:crotonobetainyl-CoA:carnitine CoA-transferase CaiB-like acyl-CoA transferase